VSKFRHGLALVVTAVVAISLILPAQAANAAGSAASPVRSLKVSDGWSSSSPRTAVAKLTWTKPSSTYGYSIIGYRIEKSYDKNTWTTVVSNTKSSSTSKTISSGLKIGIPNFFRVKAITKKGSVTKVGAASSVVGKSLTAVPVTPVLLGLNDLVTLTDSYKPYWIPQTPSQAGSAKPTYVVTATSNGQTAATCTSATNSCDLTGLVPNTAYKITLTVKNSRGTAENLAALNASDPELSRQWYLGESGGISAARAWTATRGSSKVVVAVLDSGITVHPELKDQLVSGYDFVSDATKSGDGDGIDADPTDPGDWDQTCYTASPSNKSCWSSWHGTHVAGIIAAKQDTTGITGIAPGVKIQPVRVLGSGGEGSAMDLGIAIMWSAGFTSTEIAQALQTAGRVDLSQLPTNKTPAKVINLSMAGPGSCPSVVQVAIENAQSKGVTLVSAAGNGNDNNVPQSNVSFYPTNCYGPISVGATGYTNDAAFYSNFDVDISAPGGDQRVAANNSVANSGMIYSTSNTGATEPEGPTYKYEMGTSMAAPVVSGILALMYSLRPNATRDQIWTALRDSALPFKTGGICALAPGRCGSGIANAANALRALIAITG
jgi:serine protease